MSSTGYRLKRNPRQFLPGSFDNRIVRDGMNCVFFPVLGDAHETFFLDLLLGEEGGDAALLGLWHARNECPIYLASRAGAEILGKSRSCKSGFCHQQTAGGVLVEPMHQTRTLGVRPRPAQGTEHSINMTRGAGPALHSQSHGLIEYQHIGIFVERDRLDERAVFLSLRRIVPRRRCVYFQRRNANRLTCFKARLRLRSLAVHPYLAFADDALDMTER